MPGKSPQKQVMCQAGYLVPEAFKKQKYFKHLLLMRELNKLADNTIYDWYGDIDPRTVEDSIFEDYYCERELDYIPRRIYYYHLGARADSIIMN